MAEHTGWERERKVHFGEIVEIYDRVRPTFPDRLIADIFEYCGAGAGKKALEIGAGTGKATTPFLEAGYDVTAVELSANMTEFLLNKYREFENFRVITAGFEDADVNDNNFDLVYAATAFHWVAAEIGVPKAFDLLKSGGVFALFRYNIVPNVGEESYEAIQDLYGEYYYSVYKSNERPVKLSGEDFWRPAEIKRGFGFEDMREYGFTGISTKLYDVSRTFGVDEYIDILETTSDHRAMPERERTALYAGIKDITIQHGGKHTVDYVFQLYMGRKP